MECLPMPLPWSTSSRECGRVIRTATRTCCWCTAALVWVGRAPSSRWTTCWRGSEWCRPSTFSSLCAVWGNSGCWWCRLRCVHWPRAGHDSLHRKGHCQYPYLIIIYCVWRSVKQRQQICQQNVTGRHVLNSLTQCSLHFCPMASHDRLMEIGKRSLWCIYVIDRGISVKVQPWFWCWLLVQAQYIFIHNALDELYNCGETEITAGNVRIVIGRLSRSVPGSEITGFQKQYEVLLFCLSIFHLSNNVVVVVVIRL